jgi:hypothetical protein
MMGVPQPIATLALTIAVEWPVYWALLRRRPAQVLLYAAVLNALTQPPANLLYQLFGHFWVIEAGVWLVEAALLGVLVPLRPARALLVAGVANVASAAVGLLIY